MTTSPSTRSRICLRRLRLFRREIFSPGRTSACYMSCGRLGWESSTLRYGDTAAHVIELLTEQASGAYRLFLRRLGISYIVAGRTELDYGKAFHAEGAVPY